MYVRLAGCLVPIRLSSPHFSAPKFKPTKPTNNNTITQWITMNSRKEEERDLQRAYEFTSESLARQFAVEMLFWKESAQDGHLSNKDEKRRDALIYAELSAGPCPWVGRYPEQWRQALKGKSLAVDLERGGNVVRMETIDERVEARELTREEVRQQALERLEGMAFPEYPEMDEYPQWI